VSADSTAQGVQECLQAGAQDYLVKPVDVSTLAARVRRLVVRGPIARPVRAAPASGPAAS
jgi:DNA-binding response OmpR family regulator